MHNKSEEDFFLYDSLTEEEAIDLRKTCVNDISEENFDDCCPDFLLEMLFCMRRRNPEDSLCTDTVVKVMEILIIKSSTCKLFYGDYSHDDIQKIYEMIIKDDPDLHLAELNIHLLGQAFIRVVANNEKMLLPKEVNIVLFDSYINYNPIKQKQIVKRIPFILNRKNRQFLILLKDLFNKIDENQKSTETSKSDLLHIFGPIVFKSDQNNHKIHGYHRMVILEDILSAEFFKIDKDIFIHKT